MNLTKRVCRALTLLTAFAGTAVWSQAQTAPAAESDDEPVDLGEFTVTGSHIPLTETSFDARATPVTVVTRTDIEKLGYSTPVELLQNLVVNNGGSVPISNNATGFTPAASSVSMRGLGPEATLVLINGRRVAPYPIGTGGTTAFVDLNSFPLASIERLEVLKDGASATYGADAVAGVVNIITRRNFNGTEADIRYGNTTSKDSGELSASLISGISSEEGSVTFGVNYYKRNAIFNRDRKYSEVPPFLSSNSSPINSRVSRAAVEEALGLAPGSPIPGLDDGLDPEDFPSTIYATTWTNKDNNNGALPATQYDYTTGRASAYNFNETAGSYPESERIGGFASFERKLRGVENAKLYGDIFYQRTDMVNELAPSATGNFANPGGISIVIPARTATPLGTREAAPGAYNPFNPFNQDISSTSRARLAEFGNRIYRDTNEALNIVVGIQGERVFGNWNYDASFSHSRILNTTRNSLVSISRLNRLMDANDPIFDPSSTEFIGTTEPYNPFGYYRNPIPNNELVTPFAKVDLKDRNESELNGVEMTWANGELFQMPGGPAGFAAGVEYRWEKLQQSPDAAGSTGDVIGSSTANITDEDREIGSVFGELQLPLTSPDQNIPGLHAMSVNLSARYEDFVSQNDSVFVPKVAFKWQPVGDSFVVRGSWGQGYRQPSMYELYASGLTYSLTPVTNPYTDINEPEQDVTIASSRQLKAEDSESFAIGFVYTPDFMRTDQSAFTFSFDYWDIERTGNVTVDHQDVVNRWFAGNTLLPGESVVTSGSGAGTELILVNGVFRNLGNEQINGYDISASYYWITSTAGRFDIGANVSYIDSYKIQQFAGAPFFEYIGWPTDVLFDNETGDPAPGAGDDAYLQWKGEIFADWSKGNASVHISGNYLDSYKDFRSEWDPSDPTNPAGFANVDSTFTWDLSASYRFGAGNEGLFGDTRVTVGVNNIFDTEPPFVSSWDNNSTGYSGYLYNSEGRMVYVSLNKKL